MARILLQRLQRRSPNSRSHNGFTVVYHAFLYRSVFYAWLAKVVGGVLQRGVDGVQGNFDGQDVRPLRRYTTTSLQLAYKYLEAWKFNTKQLNPT